jgi:hypothetical protein
MIRTLIIGLAILPLLCACSEKGPAGQTGGQSQDTQSASDLGEPSDTAPDSLTTQDLLADSLDEDALNSDVEPENDVAQDIVPEKDAAQDIVPEKDAAQDIVPEKDVAPDIQPEKDAPQDIVPEKDAAQDTQEKDAGEEKENTCCQENVGPGCSNQTCEIAVCTKDYYCCEFLWDSFCATCAKGGKTSTTGDCKDLLSVCGC